MTFSLAAKRFAKTVVPLLLVELFFFAVTIPVAIALREKIRGLLMLVGQAAAQLPATSNLTAVELEPFVASLGKVTNETMLFAFFIAPAVFIGLLAIMNGISWGILTTAQSLKVYVKRYALVSVAQSILAALLIGGALRSTLSATSLLFLVFIILFITREPVAICACGIDHQRTMQALTRVARLNSRTLKSVALQLGEALVTLVVLVLWIVLVLTMSLGQDIVASPAVIITYGLLCVVAQLFLRQWIAVELRGNFSQ